MAIIELLGDHVAIQKARKWLREELQIPVNKPLDGEFEAYFKCRIKRVRIDRPAYYSWEDTREGIAFLLRWT